MMVLSYAHASFHDFSIHAFVYSAICISMHKQSSILLLGYGSGDLKSSLKKNLVSNYDEILTSVKYVWHISLCKILHN